MAANRTLLLLNKLLSIMDHADTLCTTYWTGSCVQCVCGVTASSHRMNNSTQHDILVPAVGVSCSKVS